MNYVDFVSLLFIDKNSLLKNWLHQAGTLTQRKNPGVARVTCCVDAGQRGAAQTPDLLSQMSWRRASKCVCLCKQCV